MRFFHKLKYDFKSRIIFVTLSTVVIASLLIGGSIYWKGISVSEKTLRSRVVILSDIISQNIATPLIFDDVATANEILATFKADAAIVNAVVRYRSGGEFTSFRRSEIVKEENISYTQNITFNEEVIGSIYVVASKKEIHIQKAEIITFLLIVLCAVICVVLFVLIPIIKSAILPLLHLHSVSEKITQTRDYSLRVDIKTHDEVGRLSSMFNAMIEQIEHRDDMLEKQVRQRTTELEKLAEEFRFRAFHDSLTGLPNRALLNERFELSIQHAIRSESRFGCILLDLDDFKTINDTKGHEFGDALLIEVSKRLKDTIRAEDLVCRLGGDEFVIIVNDLNSLNSLADIAQKILAEINKDFSIHGERIKTAVSVGGAVYPDHGSDISIIKRHADVAMYQAKDAGKNQFCLFTEGMQEDVKFRLLIQNDLKPAIAQKQLEVYLQPKINTLKNCLAGCEALVRWNHPVEGFLPPDKFIPFAEEIGFVREIDYFVIGDCCQKILDWSQGSYEPLSIAINLSGRHFHDFKIVEVLNAAIAEYGINPQQLEIEITEAVLIYDPAKAQEVVRELKNLGFGISLDDFGTGYSSLNYLRTLPIDTVKLDRSFIANIDVNEQDRRLTRGIVSLANGLSLEMVAEGVETESQLNALAELGCHVMQGYYFLPPSPYVNFLAWYEREYVRGSGVGGSCRNS